MPRRPTSCPTEKQCDYCSRWFMRTSNCQRMCPECATEYWAEKSIESYQHKRKQQIADGKRKRLVYILGYKTVNSWPPESEDSALDFKDSIFFERDFDTSLKNGCFPNGLIVKKYGRVRIVQDKQLVMPND
jgi:hypothetical protein